MTTHVLFIHGAGTGAYDEDKKLAASLSDALGAGYEVHFPAMADEDNAPYDQWKQQIEAELASLQGTVILAGHSVGASILLKWMSENRVEKPVSGIFLLATPFWGGAGWRYGGYEELALADGFAARLPAGVPVFVYHAHDDQVVPFEHLALYAQTVPQATVREIEAGGHQFNDDLSGVAQDIKALSGVS